MSRTTVATQGVAGAWRKAVAWLRAEVLIDPAPDISEDSEAAMLRRRLRRGWLFSAVWLGYLFYPFRAMFTSTAPLGWTIAGSVSLIVFGAAFLLGFRDFRGRIYAERGVGLAGSWMLLLVLAALLVPVAPAAGDSVLTGCVYIAVLGILILPPKHGVALLVVMVAAVEILPRSVPSWSPDDSAAFSVLVAAFAAWGIGQLVIRNVQLDQARRKLSELAVVEERERVARDVHDILGHSLTVITMKAELAGRLVELDPAAAAREIADVESLSRAALSDVRSTVGGLRHLRLETELPGVRSAVEAAGMTLHIEGRVTDVVEQYRELFAWALREAVTNAVRHSGANAVTVRLEPHRLTVSDDGRGPAGESTGNGLRGLIDRAGAVGASVRVARGATGGFVLTVTAA